MLNTCLFVDARDGLRQINAAGIRPQTVVTSPPYFGLRDYGHPGQLGLERTPDEYIAAMVEVFRAVREVMADDGTLWLNIGDSYGSKGGNTYAGFNQRWSGTGGPGSKQDKTLDGVQNREIETGLKPKDLIGIPWMLAFALRADGWYLRQDIIWHKPNPMPESVRDRCTKAHEYLFLLSKSERYYFDSDAIAEPSNGYNGSTFTRGKTFEAANSLSAVGTAERVEHDTRNRRSVWTIATTPYSGAHFATFPPALIEPCILAGSRPGDVVLDPFLGSGTTARVAMALGRQWIGCEINPEYKALQDGRTREVQIRMEGYAP